MRLFTGVGGPRAVCRVPGRGARVQVHLLAGERGAVGVGPAVRMLGESGASCVVRVRVTHRYRSCSTTAYRILCRSCLCLSTNRAAPHLRVLPLISYTSLTQSAFLPHTCTPTSPSPFRTLPHPILIPILILLPRSARPPPNASVHPRLLPFLLHPHLHPRPRRLLLHKPLQGRQKVRPLRPERLGAGQESRPRARQHGGGQRRGL